MHLSELIEALVEVQERLGDFDPQVLLGTQPHYPLASTIRGVVAEEGYDSEDEEEPASSEHGLPVHNGEEVVWLTEGSQHREAPYAPRWIFQL